MEGTTGRTTATTSHPSHCERDVGTGMSPCCTGKGRKRENPAYPAWWVTLNSIAVCACVQCSQYSLMPSHTHYASAELGTRVTCRGQQRSKDTGVSSSTTALVHESIDTKVPVLPEQVILRHRLTLTEIRELPRFRDYHAGHPTRVSYTKQQENVLRRTWFKSPHKVLYVKNLHPRVSSDDLKAIFDRYSAGDGNRVTVRLMTGRMKGQAFIEFPCKHIRVLSIRVTNITSTCTFTLF